MQTVWRDLVAKGVLSDEPLTEKQWAKEYRRAMELAKRRISVGKLLTDGDGDALSLSGSGSAALSTSLTSVTRGRFELPKDPQTMLSITRKVCHVPRPGGGGGAGCWVGFRRWLILHTGARGGKGGVRGHKKVLCT